MTSLIHFGTSSDQDRASAKTLTDFEAFYGIPEWLQYNGEKSSACSISPLHISANGVFAQKYDSHNIKYGPGVYDYVEYQSNFGVSAFMSETIADKAGVHYADAITISAFIDGQDRTGTYSGGLLARSTMIGGECLNLTTKSYYDVEVLSDGSFTGGAGSVCTITWNSPYGTSQSIPGTAGLITATIVSSGVVNSICYTKLRISDYVDVLPIDVLNPSSDPRSYVINQQSYCSPWNLLPVSQVIYSADSIAGYSIGMSTITFSDLTDASIFANSNEFSPSVDNYSDNINTVDRFDGKTMVSLPTKKGAVGFKARFKSPMQVDDFIWLGGDYPSLGKGASRGSIAGPVVDIVSNSTLIKSDIITISSTDGHLYGSMKFGDSITSNGKSTSLRIEGGNLYIGYGCNIILEGGSKIIMKDGSRINEELGSTISPTTERSANIFALDQVVTQLRNNPMSPSFEYIGLDSAMQSYKTMGSLWQHWYNLVNGSFDTYMSGGSPFATPGTFSTMYKGATLGYPKKGIFEVQYAYDPYPNSNSSWPFDAAYSITPTKITLDLNLSAFGATPDAMWFGVDIRVTPFSIGHPGVSYTASSVGFLVPSGGMIGWQFGNAHAVITDSTFLNQIKSIIDPGISGPAANDMCKIEIARSSSSANRFCNLAIANSRMDLTYLTNSRP
jgi:hypothetical protein